MSTSSETITCKVCGRIISLPANFCDLCGADFQKSTFSQIIRSSLGKIKIYIARIKVFLGEKNNQELLLRIGIPTFVLVSGLFMFFSANPQLNRLLFFLFPAMAGAAVGAANIKEINDVIEKSNNWILNKLEAVKDKGGKRHKYYFKPWFWMLNQINNLSDQIVTLQIRNAFKISAYLYICFLMLFIAYMAVVIVVLLVILAVTFMIISFFSDRDTPSYRTSSVSNRIRGKKLYNTKGFFDKQTHRIDEKGNVYDTSGLFEKQVGKITDDGHILSTEGIFSKQTGKIDGDGNIYDSSGIIDKKVGEILEDGTIKDTKGIIGKPTGKLK